MRLESFKRRWIGDSKSRLTPDCSSSFDSADEDAKIRLDDPSLRLTIAESPSPTSERPEINFSDQDLDTNMNRRPSNGEEKCSPPAWHNAADVFSKFVM